MKNKVMVIVAHPDDEVLGCGGTIARHLECDDDVYVLFMACGSRNVVRNVQTDISELEAQVSESLCKLGAMHIEKSYKMYMFPDQNLDSVSEVQLNKVIEDEIEEYKPTIVYTHFANDINKDHELVSKSVRVACRSKAGSTVRELYEFLTISSSNFNTVHAPFEPDYYIQILGGQLSKKMDAIKCYKEENTGLRSTETIGVTARYWGFNVGVQYAEVFKTIRRKG